MHCASSSPLPHPKLNEAAQGAEPGQPIDGFPPPPHHLLPGPHLAGVSRSVPFRAVRGVPCEHRSDPAPLTPKPSIAPISLKMEAKSRWWSLSPLMSSPPTRFPPPLVLLPQCSGLIARSCLRAFARIVSLPRTPSSGSPRHPLPHFIQASAQTSPPLKGLS